MQHSGDCPASIGPMACCCGAEKRMDAEGVFHASPFMHENGPPPRLAPHIVGFTGLRRSGKDTAAGALIDGGYERISFAGPLKTMLRTLLREQGLGWQDIDAMIDGHLKEAPSPFLNGCTPRFAMQTLGTEWGRDIIHPNLWVDAALRAAAFHSRVVITDVRFPNEVDAIHRAGGLVIRVNRPTLPPADEHSSEALVATLDADHDIENSGSIDNLHELVFLALACSQRSAAA